MKVVYIAGPLTTGGTLEENYAKARRWCRLVLQAGYAVYSPHQENVGLEDALDYEGWMQVGKEFIDRADAVFFIPGYEKSKGSMLELEYVQRIGKPYFFSLETLRRSL